MPLGVIAVNQCRVDHEASKLWHPRVTPQFSNQRRPRVVPQFNFASAHMLLVAMLAAIGHHSPKSTLLSPWEPVVIHFVQLR